MPSEDPVAALQRWTDSGGTLRVLHRTESTVTVALLTCYGEEADRSTWPAGPELTAYLSEVEHAAD